ncbi:hypothetical protein CDAR_211381 [Caerostris darwini]|uniref:Uncharacterized protein n=1 Tax=Caerostris darwini TaxID=1538125 RepID=A0AAV4W053_9ARAC|nr:hypothetical protein CDAR_211381 [Caerostris darwini]
MHAQYAMLGKWKSARLQYQKHTNASLCPPYGLEDSYFQLKLPTGVNAKDPFFIMHAQSAMLGKWKSARLQYQKHTNASLCPPYGLEELYFQLRLPTGVNAKGEKFSPIQSGNYAIKYARTVQFK